MQPVANGLGALCGGNVHGGARLRTDWVRVAAETFAGKGMWITGASVHRGRRRWRRSGMSG